MAAVRPLWTEISPEEHVVQLERAWFDAYLKRDVATLDRILADDYTFIAPNGQVVTKSAGWSRLGRLHYDRLEVDDIHVRLYGDTAVLTARVQVEGRLGDEDLSGAYRHTRVYARQNGSWRAVAGQSTRVAQS